MSTTKTVLFDLDGTLLDTHVDLCNALNKVLENHDRPPLPIASMRSFVSKGAMVMVCLAFKCLPNSEQAKQMWKEMLDAYEQDIATHTQLFPGMDSVLEHIVSTGKNWGIVTNKPGFYTQKLLDIFKLPTEPGTVISGDTLAVKKPDPAPLLLACDNLAADPEHTIYIGDDERDIQAGKNARMRTIAVSYGYIVDEESPSDWGADFVVDSAFDIVPVISAE